MNQHFYSFLLLLVTSLSAHLSILVVLSGTKYGLKQTRGKFGLGAKMVLATCTSYIFFSLCSILVTVASFSLECELHMFRFRVVLLICVLHVHRH